MVNPWRRSFTINKACLFENGARASEAEGFWGVGDFVLFLGDVFLERAGQHAFVLRCRQYLTGDVGRLYYGVDSACWMASVASIDGRVCRSLVVSFAVLRRMEDSAWLRIKSDAFAFCCLCVCVILLCPLRLHRLYCVRSRHAKRSVRFCEEQRRQHIVLVEETRWGGRGGAVFCFWRLIAGFSPTTTRLHEGAGKSDPPLKLF